MYGAANEAELIIYRGSGDFDFDTTEHSVRETAKNIFVCAKHKAELGEFRKYVLLIYLCAVAHTEFQTLQLFQKKFFSLQTFHNLKGVYITVTCCCCCCGGGAANVGQRPQ